MKASFVVAAFALLGTAPLQAAESASPAEAGKPSFSMPASYFEDARCLLQAGTIIRLHSGEVRDAATRMAAFYMGRLDDRSADVVLEAVLESLADADDIDGPESQIAARRDPTTYLNPYCARTMERSSKVVTDIALRLVKKGLKAKRPPQAQPARKTERRI